MTVVYSKGFYQTCEKSDGTCSNGADNLFTISGGPIMVTNLFPSIVAIIIKPPFCAMIIGFQAYIYRNFSREWG